MSEHSVLDTFNKTSESLRSVAEACSTTYRVMMHTRVSEFDLAVEAVRELIEADTKYDNALTAFNSTTATLLSWPQVHARFEQAKSIRAAALARCKGITP